MKRHHFFEFGDQPWLRGWARECYLDCLNFGLRGGGQFRGALAPLLRWCDGAGDAEILDLASGGGGPVETLILEARKAGKRLPRIVLSDLYPAVRHYEALAATYGPGQIGFEPGPVDASQVPPPPPRLRMIVSALHHFRPDDAAALVRDCAGNADGLFIAEPLQRNLRHFLLVLLSGPLPYMGAPFAARRKSPWKFLFCTLIPVFPLLVMFDGCVSVLRSYTHDEIRAMFPEDLRNAFTFETGTAPYLKFFGMSFFAARRSVQR